jgi:hypothetical protein
MLGILLDGGHLAGEGGKTAGRHPVAQEIHLRNGEGTLLKIDDQPCRMEVAENLLHIPLVLLHGGAGDDDIVEVDESKCQPCQYPVHEPLECAASVPQAKGEAEELKQPKRCNDGSL